MSALPLVSLIVNNYNYGQFLGPAIDSALSQTYGQTEVIVVDDGSTDQSRQVIGEYRDRITPVLKENGGQTSTFNAGFAISRGEIVLFLDADDLLSPALVEKLVLLFQDSAVVKAHWPLYLINERGQRMGGLKPPHPVPEGDLRQTIVQYGPDSPDWPPTSGNAWARRFLERVFPMPEVERQYRIGSASADAYLSMLAPLFGRTARIAKPQGSYRVHGRNDHSAMDFYQRLTRDVALFEYRCEVLCRYCKEAGVEVDPNVWRQRAWCHRLHRSVRDLLDLIPSGERFILVDDGCWQMSTSDDLHPIPFLERDGQYWGPPPDDATAVRELERMRKNGAGYMVFGWTAFWWLDHYLGLQRYLRAEYACLLENDNLLMFCLRS